MYGLCFSYHSLAGCRAILKRERGALARADSRLNADAIRFEEACIDREIMTVEALMSAQRIEERFSLDLPLADPTRVAVICPDVLPLDIAYVAQHLLYFERLYMLPPFVPGGMPSPATGDAPTRACSALRWYHCPTALESLIEPYWQRGLMGVPAPPIMTCIASLKAINSIQRSLANGMTLLSSREDYLIRLIENGGVEALLRMAEVCVAQAVLTPNVIGSSPRWERRLNEWVAHVMPSPAAGRPFVSGSLQQVPALATAILRACKLTPDRCSAGEIEGLRSGLNPHWDRLSEVLEAGSVRFGIDVMKAIVAVERTLGASGELAINDSTVRGILKLISSGAVPRDLAIVAAGGVGRRGPASGECPVAWRQNPVLTELLACISRLPEILADEAERCEEALAEAAESDERLDGLAA